jgi:hypothetical protein
VFSNFEADNQQVLPIEKDAHLVKIRLKRKTTNLTNFFSKECTNLPHKKITRYPDPATDI